MGVLDDYDPTLEASVSPVAVRGAAILDDYDPTIDLLTKQPTLLERQKVTGFPLGLREPVPAPPGVDIETGAPFSVRAGASVKMTTAGKLNYLKSKYGLENVRARGNEIDYINPDTQQWTQFDEKGLSISDIADLTGPAIESIPGVVAGFATANPLIAGAADAGASAIRQGISASLPGADQMTVGGRLGNIAIAGGLGITFQGTSNIAEEVIKKVRPTNILKRYLNRKVLGDPSVSASELGRQSGFFASPKGQAVPELLDLEKKTGLTFTPGQVTQDPGLLTLEGSARRNPISAAMVQAGDTQRLSALQTYLQKIMADIGEGKAGIESAGNKVKLVWDSHIEKAVKERSASAKNAFTAAIEKQKGSDIPVTASNFLSTISEVIRDLNTRLGGDATVKQLEELAKIKNKLSQVSVDDITGEIKITAAGGDPMSLGEFQRGLEIWGKAARGTGKPLEAFDSQGNKRVARRVFPALLRDLDSMISKGVPGAAELKVARQEYRAMSEFLEETKTSILTKVLGLGSGEHVFEKFVGNTWKPSQKKAAMAIVDSLDGELAKDIRVLALEDIISKAVPQSGSIGALDIGLSPAKLISAANKNDDGIRALFAGDHKGYLNWREAVKAAKVLAYRAGTDGSPTTPLRQAETLLEMMKKTGRLDFSGLAGESAAILAPRVFAEAMLDPKASRDMLSLLGAPAFLKHSKGAMERMVAFSQQEELQEILSSEDGALTP